ncbi:MAG: hypothetical protein R3B47_11150 [Bacteroidia bacterium]
MKPSFWPHAPPRKAQVRSRWSAPYCPDGFCTGRRAERERIQLEKEIGLLAEGKIEERKNLERSTEEAETNWLPKRPQLEYCQRIDSLKYELDGMGRVASVLTHMDRIERQRLARVEQPERQLAEAEAVKYECRAHSLTSGPANLPAARPSYQHASSAMAKSEAAKPHSNAEARSAASLSPSK